MTDEERLMPPHPEQPPHASSKVMRVTLWLCVERNSKFVRGQKRAREDIEWWVLSRYQMKKLCPDGWEYELSIPYETDKDLEETIYDDILAEAERIADSRHCFIEANITSADDPDRSWF
jgi:hypothetical protein